MTDWNDKARVAVGKVGLELPAAIVKKKDTPIDSASGVFEGQGVQVIVDQGPFADRLDSHVGRPGYREEIKDVMGTKGRVIFFRTPERGTYTVAIHLPAPRLATVVVHADASVPESVARQIIESIQFLN